MDCKPERARYVGNTVEKLMEGMVSQTLKELTAIYSTRYAAIQHKKKHRMSDPRVCAGNSKSGNCCWASGPSLLDSASVAVAIGAAPASRLLLRPPLRLP